MGLLDLFPERRAIDASSFGLNNGDLSGALGGVTVDEAAALSVPTFAACVDAKVDAIAAMPVDAYRSDGERRVPVDGPAWLQAPNDEDLWPDFVGALEFSLAVDRNAFVAVMRDRSGRAAQLMPVDHAKVQVVRHRGRRLFEVDGREFPGEMIHISHGKRPGALRAESLVERNKPTLAAAVAVQKYALDFFERGGVPPFVFAMSGVTPDRQAMEATAKWWRRARQRNGFHAPGFVWGGTPVPLGYDAEKTQLAAVQATLGVQIASFMSVPTQFVGLGAAGDGITYQNVVQAFVNFMRKSMTRPMGDIEKALSADRNMLMPKAVRIRFRTEIFEKADTKSRYECYQIGLAAGFLTVEDVRALEDLEALPPDPGSPSPA